MQGNSSVTTDPTLPDPGTANSVAMCDPGDAVLSGSYTILNQFLLIRFIEDRALSNQDGWRTILNGSSFPIEDVVPVITFAQCFDHPPLR